MYIKYLDIQKWCAFFQRIDTIFFIQNTIIFLFIFMDILFHKLLSLQVLESFIECTQVSMFNVYNILRNAQNFVNSVYKKIHRMFTVLKIQHTHFSKEYTQFGISNRYNFQRI